MQRTVRHEWDLASLPDLAPGAEIEWRVVASDYQPQEGPSAARRITIISPEDHEERVVQRQAEILAQIAEVARLQRQTREQTTQLSIPLREVGVLNRDEVDQLQGAELNQRQVQQRLGHPSDGIETQVAELIRDLQSNGVESSAAVERLGQLRDGIAALNQDALPRIEHHLVDAVQAGPRGSAACAARIRRRLRLPVREPLQQLLGDVATAQEEVVRALEQMLGQLSQWDSYRRLATEVGRFRREQSEVRQRTESLRQETISKDVQDLTDAQCVALYRLAEQQNDIALRFDVLEGRMNSMRAGTGGEGPASRRRADTAMTMARRAGVSADMRDAANQMESNRLSQATQQQDEVVQWLGELQDILAHRRKDTQEFQRRERLGQLFEAVTLLLERQQRVGTQTSECDQRAPAAEGGGPDDRRQTVERLATEQAVLARDLAALQQTVADVDSFAMALREAGQAATRRPRACSNSTRAPRRNATSTKRSQCSRDCWMCCARSRLRPSSPTKRLPIRRPRLPSRTCRAASTCSCS